MHNSVLAEKKHNKLINEKSPYLLQHAYNPINWYPWSNEAFEKAKEDISLYYYLSAIHNSVFVYMSLMAKSFPAQGQTFETTYFLANCSK